MVESLQTYGWTICDQKTLLRRYLTFETPSPLPFHCSVLNKCISTKKTKKILGNINLKPFNLVL